MTKVITYGTYDLIHHGHIRLLERAKALGDYLVVGVTADDFDKTRGKINVQQTLIERIEGVRSLGIANEIIVEEYEGQKIDDIKRMGIDIFTVGSDWVGKFDYLNEYCKVIYLERTIGVSSSELRAQKRELSIGLVGDLPILAKFYQECSFANGVRVGGIQTRQRSQFVEIGAQSSLFEDDYQSLLARVDAIYLVTPQETHYEMIKAALDAGKHVLCSSPMALTLVECKELFDLARQKGLILADALKTAYSTAYSRLILLVKSGKIGDVVAIDVTCTSMTEDLTDINNIENRWNSICAWGPTALLPIFHLLGTEYISKRIQSKIIDDNHFDAFSKIDFVYKNAVATAKVARGVKSEGEMIISGTKGYIYVPAPWWKTDYFEMRFEDQTQNKRYFYQLDGDGIRYEIVAFAKAIKSGINSLYVDEKTTDAFTSVIEDYYNDIDLVRI